MYVLTNHTPPNLCCSGESDIFPKLSVVAYQLFEHVVLRKCEGSVLSVSGMIGKLGNHVYNIYG